MKKVQTEYEEESGLVFLSSAGCNKEGDFKSLTSSRQAVEYASSEAGTFQEEETRSISTEEDELSDLESNRSVLEPGEISLVREGFGEERMKII